MKLIVDLWSIILHRKVMFSLSGCCTSPHYVHVYYELKKPCMCSLEIVMYSSWISEITPRYALENANHHTVILKPSVTISVGVVLPAGCYRYLDFFIWVPLAFCQVKNMKLSRFSCQENSLSRFCLSILMLPGL